MKDTEFNLNVRFAGINGLFWIANCCTFGFVSVFLSDKSFSAGDIGFVLAWANILATLLQNYSAEIVDKSSKVSLKHIINIIGALVIAAMLALYFMPDVKLAVGAVFILECTGIMVFIPLINSLGVYLINRGWDINYGLARSIGSILYAVISAIAGKLVKTYGSESVMLIGAAAMALLLVILAFFKNIVPAGTLRSKEQTAETKDIGFIAFLRKYPSYIVFLVGMILIMSHHMAITNYLYHISCNIGGDSATMGMAAAIAAIVEVPAMGTYAIWGKKFQKSKLIIFSAVFYFIKAVLTFCAGNIAGLYVAQTMQMLAFAVYTPTSVYFTDMLMEEEDRNKGQAFLCSANTIGGVLGSLIGGRIINSFGVSSMLFVGIIVSFAGALTVTLSVLTKRTK